MSVIADQVLDYLNQCSLRSTSDTSVITDQTFDWYLEHDHVQVVRSGLYHDDVILMTAHPDGRWRVSLYRGSDQAAHTCYISATALEDAVELLDQMIEGSRRMFAVNPVLLNEKTTEWEGKTFHLGWLHVLPERINAWCHSPSGAQTLRVGATAAALVVALFFTGHKAVDANHDGVVDTIQADPTPDAVYAATLAGCPSWGQDC